MKKLLILALLLTITGCAADISGQTVGEFEKFCSTRGGILYIEPEAGYSVVYCRDGSNASPSNAAKTNTKREKYEDREEKVIQ